METVLPILLGIGLAIVMSIEWSGRRRTRAWRALRNAPHLLCAQVKNDSLARITGTASAIGALRRSPIGARACIGYRLEIATTYRQNQTVVFSKEECDPFAIADESGKATVDGPVLFGLDWEKDWSPLPAAGYAILKAAGVSTGGIFLSRRFVFRQALLQSGDRVSACGQAFLEPDPTQPLVGLRSPALRPHLRGTQNDGVAVADAAGLRGAA